MLNVFGPCLGDDERHVGPASALVIAELGKPRVAPSLRSLRLPKNDASRLADGAVDLLNDIGAQFALADRLDEVTGKRRRRSFSSSSSRTSP